MDPVSNAPASCRYNFPASRSFLRAGVCLSLLASTAGGGRAAAAVPPEVQFDVNNVVACRDVTPPDFARLNPAERLIEARFQVSALLTRGAEQDLRECSYQVVSSRRTMRVVDYAPKTTLVSDVAGPIAVEEWSERNEQVNLGLTTPGPLPINVSGYAESSARSQQTRRYEMLPELVPVAASGPIERGYGVYFKLKPSRRGTLEGAHDFVVVFRVPRSWRGDSVHVLCRAVGSWQTAVPVLTETALCGAERFTVALYGEGDPAAQAAAERLVRAESALVQAVSAHRRAIEKHLYPTLAHRMGLVAARVPANWAEQLVADPLPPALAPVRDRLPTVVQDAVAQYALAKRELRSLTIGGASVLQ